MLKKIITNRLSGGEYAWRLRAHSMNHASHTYYTSFPFPTPRVTLCVGCGLGCENPRNA